MRVSINLRRYASHIALVSSMHEPSNCLEEERHDTLMEDNLKISSKFATNGILLEYNNRIVGFS